MTFRAGTFKSALDFLGSVAFIAACAAVVWSVMRKPAVPSASAIENSPTPTQARPEAPLPTEPISLDGAILDGDRGAGVVVIEYSEFQCPYCGKFANETLPTIKRKYVDSGKVLWAFRHFPLEQIHGNAVRAATAAECAAQQGKFQQMHNVLFSNQQELGAAQLDEYARRTGLDMAKYSACMAGPTEAKVRADMKEGQSLGLTGTPTFFLGHLQPDGTVRVKKRLFGASNAATFERELEAQLTSTVASAH